MPGIATGRPQLVYSSSDQIAGAVAFDQSRLPSRRSRECVAANTGKVHGLTTLHCQRRYAAHLIAAEARLMRVPRSCAMGVAAGSGSSW
jgi:hypothetical protein